MKLIEDYLDQLVALRDNPVGVQEIVYTTMEAMSNGKYQMHDASNPLAFMIETACATATAGMMRNDKMHQRQNPHLARTDQDLYYNLTDMDMSYSFAEPARVNMPLLLNYKELKIKAVRVDKHLSVLRLPKDTDVTVGGLVFTMMYPIDIRLYDHGGIQVVSDLSDPDPKCLFETNRIEWRTLDMPGEFEDRVFPEKMLYLEVPLRQVANVVYHEQVTESGGFSKEYTYPNHLADVAVYHKDTKSGKWLPIKVSFDQSYSIDELVVVAKRLNSSVHLSIPKIFFKRKMVPRGIRVDILNTKGKVDASLEKYHPGAYAVAWKSHDRSVDPRIDAVRELASISFFNDRPIRGGTDGPTFNELKRRILEGTVAARQTPIVEAGIRRNLHDMGYRIRPIEDGVANRMYIASRSLLERPGDPLRLPMGSLIETFLGSVSRLPVSSSIMDHGKVLVFKEGLFFKMTDGILSIMDDISRAHLFTGTVEEVVTKIRAIDFYALPYHYVLDTSAATSLTAYHLSAPRLIGKEYVSENPSTGLELRCFDIGISHREDHYVVVVRTIANKAVVEINTESLHAQLSFIPKDEETRVYLTGDIIGRDDNDAPIFEFIMPSGFKVDSGDKIHLSGFERWGDSRDTWQHGLTQEYDLLFMVSGASVEGSTMSEIDMIKGDAFLPGGSRGIIHEKMTVQWGRKLNNLWTRCRSTSTKEIYEHHVNDVPAVYTDDVLIKDPATGLPKWSIIDGVVKHEGFVHKKGDLVYDDQGEVVLLHRAGDPVIEHGKRVKKHSRNIAYQMDLLLVPGEWYVVTDKDDIAYRRDAIGRLADWCVRDIEAIKSRLIENTDMKLRPMRTVGKTLAVGGAGAKYVVQRDQSLKVHLEVSPMIYRNPTFRDNIQKTVLGVLHTALKMDDLDRTYSRLDIKSITEALQNELGEGVEEVRITGLGGSLNVDSLSLYENDEALSIRRVASIAGSGDITMSEDISFEWTIAD